MASAKIMPKNPGTVKTIKTSDSPQLSVIDKTQISKIIKTDFNVENITGEDYAITKIRKTDFNSVIKQELPFRVKFINIGIEGYGPNNVPPIGIAIIGINNYIL